MTSFRARLWALTVAVPTLALMVGLSCGEAAGNGEGVATFTVRDSAGVTLVENRDSSWTSETRWHLTTEPDLVIGSVDGSVPGTDFGWIRKVVSLSSGGVAVLEGDRDEIRVFDAGGRWTGTFGGIGDGPTEFRLLTEIGAVAGDSVAAFGDRHRKVVTFPTEGGEARTIPTPERLHAGYYGWEMVGWRPDGSYVLLAADDPRTGPQGLAVDSARFVLFSAAGDSLGTYGPSPRVLRKLDGEIYGPVIPSTSATSLIGDGALWHGFPDEGFELTSVDLDTGNRRIVRRHHDPVPTPDGLLDDVAAREIDELRGTPVEDAVRARWAVAVQLETLPAFSSFEVSSDGSVWVQAPAHPDDVDPDERSSGRWPAASHWTVFDPEGRWLGTMETPERFVVHEVGPDWILGVREDELEIPYVERYRVVKP